MRWTILDQKPAYRKGNGSKAAGQVGHRRKTKNGKVKYLHGLGCEKHDDCFTCPFDDCVWNG